MLAGMWSRACGRLGALPVVSWIRPQLSKLRQGAVCLALLGGAAYFATVIDPRYAIKDWLFWRYARYWAYTVLFALSCASAGHRVLPLIAPRRRPLLEHALLSFTVGLFVFYLGVVGFGLLGALGTTFAFVWPLALLGSGGFSLLQHVRKRARRAAYLRARIPALQPRLTSRLVSAFGIANLVILYLTILLPDNVGYDSRWYHLAIAEHYAAGGRVAAFAEGWYQGTLPHLASFIYTWAFLVPGQLFDRIELCAHLEMVALLATLAGVSVLSRRLLPRVRTPGAWVAFFLFHQLLMQSNFATGNDTFGALWAAPVFIALLDAWPLLAPRACALLGVLIAGALSTKYQTISALVLPVLAVPVRALGGALGRLQHRPLPRVSWLGGPLAAGLSCVVLMGPLWLTNWAWHGDPLYPFLYQHLHLRPWTADSAHLVETVLEPALWKPRGPLLSRIDQTLPVLLNFSFKPNDFGNWNDLLPMFGSLFTLVLPALPFLRFPRRAWALVLAAHVGVGAWYWTHHQDRYLIMIVPWMAAVVAAVIVLVWRMGILPRLALLCMVGLELIWGAGASFLPIHPMVGDTMLKRATDFIHSGFRWNGADRFRTYEPWSLVGPSLPKNAKVLIHDARLHLGIGAMSVSDFGGAFQGGISYGRWPSPAQMYGHLTAMGVTHILWIPGSTDSMDSLAGELMFYDFVNRQVEPARDIGNLRVAAMPRRPVKDEGWRDTVAVLACGGGYDTGVYHVGQLTISSVGSTPLTQFPRPMTRREPDDYSSLGFVLNDRGCHPALSVGASKNFLLAVSHGNLEFWVRRPGT